MSKPSAVIHGTGLIGASVGLGLRAQGWVVGGWDPDAGTLDEALRRGAIDNALTSPTSGVDHADLVVLAGPPASVAAGLGALNTESLVTDVAGVKGPIVPAATHLAHFVGGHPMAGGATSGPSLAASTLFHGATWVLTTDDADRSDIESMSTIVKSLGANPVTMTAEEHDRSVALVSHLPHVVAAALMRVVAGDRPAVELAGGGFRDLTRVAGSGSGWWTEILSANANHVRGAITDLEIALGAWKKQLSDDDLSLISAELEQARLSRTRLSEHHAYVNVVLLDRPGEIARVGHALETSRVDVRDFQLRHGEHGGGGILTISVTPAGEEALREALEESGFTLQP